MGICTYSEHFKRAHGNQLIPGGDIRGRIEENERCRFQVTLKVGFWLDEPQG